MRTNPVPSQEFLPYPRPRTTVVKLQNLTPVLPLSWEQDLTSPKLPDMIIPLSLLGVIKHILSPDRVNADASDTLILQLYVHFKQVSATFHVPNYPDFRIFCAARAITEGEGSP